MSLFSVGKRILAKYPSLTKIAASIFNFVCFNRIYGKRENKVCFNSSFLKKCRIKIKGKNNEIVFGEKCYFDKCTVSVTGNNNKIIIGDTVCAHKSSMYMEDDGGAIMIGDKTLVCGPTSFSCIEGRTIKIGADCLFSSDTILRTGDSHSVLDMDGLRVNPSQDIIIGDRVWFGVRSMCMKGVEVANDSVISAGAIVTKKFEQSNIAIAGVPAKIVKENITWCEERI